MDETTDLRPGGGGDDSWDRGGCRRCGGTAAGGAECDAAGGRGSGGDAEEEDAGSDSAGGGEIEGRGGCDGGDAAGGISADAGVGREAAGGEPGAGAGAGNAQAAAVRCLGGRKNPGTMKRRRAGSYAGAPALILFESCVRSGWVRGGPVQEAGARRGVEMCRFVSRGEGGVGVRGVVEKGCGGGGGEVLCAVWALAGGGRFCTSFLGKVFL